MTRRHRFRGPHSQSAISEMLTLFAGRDKAWTRGLEYGSPLDRIRESRDPKWNIRRAGLTAALEAKRAAQEAAAATSAEARQAAAEDRIADLEDDVARLTLVTMTMMEMLVRKGIATREELSALVAEIDALDGELDGKLDPSALRPAPEDTEPSAGA